MFGVNVDQFLSSHFDQRRIALDRTRERKQLILYYHSAFAQVFFVIFKANTSFSL